MLYWAWTLLIINRSIPLSNEEKNHWSINSDFYWGRAWSKIVILLIIEGENHPHNTLPTVKENASNCWLAAVEHEKPSSAATFFLSHTIFWKCSILTVKMTLGIVVILNIRMTPSCPLAFLLLEDMKHSIPFRKVHSDPFFLDSRFVLMIIGLLALTPLCASLVVDACDTFRGFYCTAN